VLLLAVALVCALAACSPPSSQGVDGAAPTAPPSPGVRTPRAGQRPPRQRPTPSVPVAPTEAPAVERARTPRQLAQILTTAETAIRDVRVRGTALEQAAWSQQLAYRLLAQKRGWQNRVVAMVPPRLRAAVRRNLGASTSLGSLVTPQRELPDWRILRPAPAVELLAAYRRAGAEFGIDWHYLAAIHLVETRMGRIRGKSTAGAQGPMQFMPATWDAYGKGDINDNGDAIMAAARYLAASGAPGDMRDALWHYNHSDHYVDAVSAYAANMRDDERAYRGYYYWQVYYTTRDGVVHLPEGYGTP
jgi:membrane-bound lytic murein transglycosylase B